MAEYTANQITIANGSKAVVIESGESPENVRQGDFLFVTGSDPVAINRTYINADNKHVIELTKNWGQANKNNQPAIVLPSTAEYKAVADALKNANLLVNDNFVAMQDWQTKTGTVTFVNIDGTTTTVKTLKQIESEAQAQLDAYHPHPWAMRKVEFEARRAANNEKFAASGFVHFGQHLTSTQLGIVGEGLSVADKDLGRFKPDTFALGRMDGNVSGSSKTGYPVVVISGIMFELKYLCTDQDYEANIVKLPPAEDGTRTYDSATGQSVTHATSEIAFSSETETNKVVTDREDLWGFESFLRPLTENDPFVYPGGVIQTLAPYLEGLGTRLDDVRPDSYFSWFEGDVSSRGRGVNWFEISEEQKIKIASKPENNIYFDDESGKFFQFCIRGRSFAGAGNGSWEFIDASIDSYLYAPAFESGGFSRVVSQGVLDSGGGVFTSNGSNTYTRENVKTLGDLRTRRDASALGRECYLLICGTVNRLNSGIYHPTFNQFGTAKSTGNRFWHTPGQEALSRSLCFSQSRIFLPSGNASSDKSGRPDGKFYDAIASSGQGGISKDLRLSAWGLTDVEFTESMVKAAAGLHRGHENLPLTQFYPLSDGVVDYKTIASGVGIFKVDGWGAFTGLESTFIGLFTGAIVVNGEVYPIDDLYKNSGNELVIRSTAARDFLDVGDIISTLIYTRKGGASIAVGGQYTLLEVVGNPKFIREIDDLREGWVGYFNPSIPKGTGSVIKGMRRAIVNFQARATTGSSWYSSGMDYVNTKNTVEGVVGEDSIHLVNYIVDSFITTPSELMGISSIFSIQRELLINKSQDRAGLLSDGLIGKVLESTNSNGGLFHTLTGYSLDGGEFNYPREETITHSPFQAAEPNHGDYAVKAVAYGTEVNNQGYLTYVYNELKYDGDWGDDGKIHITDNQATRLDDNGNSVVYGTARIVEPLGWIKNDK